MKLFQSLRIHLERVGITPYESNQRLPFKQRNIQILCLIGLTSLLNWVQFLHVASNFQEYVDAAFAAISSMTFCFAYATIIIKTKAFYLCLNDAEKLINESVYICINLRWRH